MQHIEQNVVNPATTEGVGWGGGGGAAEGCERSGSCEARGWWRLTRESRSLSVCSAAASVDNEATCLEAALGARWRGGDRGWCDRGVRGRGVRPGAARDGVVDTLARRVLGAFHEPRTWTE